MNCCARHADTIVGKPLGGAALPRSSTILPQAKNNSTTPSCCALYQSPPPFSYPVLHPKISVVSPFCRGFFAEACRLAQQKVAVLLRLLNETRVPSSNDSRKGERPNQTLDTARPRPLVLSRTVRTNLACASAAEACDCPSTPAPKFSEVIRPTPPRSIHPSVTGV